MNTAMTAVANSGAELPAAINVAPATSGWMWKAANQKMSHYSTQFRRFLKCMVTISLAKLAILIITKK